MPEAKPTRKGAQPPKKPFEAKVDSFLEDLHIIANGTEETAPKPAGQPQPRPVVTKLIDFIKKM